MIESLENTTCNCNLCKFMKIAVKYPRSYSTNDLRAWIINTNRPHFNEKVVANVFKHQDAHEFLTALTELCENLWRLTSFSKKTLRKCTICFKTSELVQDFNEFMHKISESNNNVESIHEINCISSLTRYCENCKDDVDHQTKDSFASVPDILIIGLIT